MSRTRSAAGASVEATEMDDVAKKEFDAAIRDLSSARRLLVMSRREYARTFGVGDMFTKAQQIAELQAWVEAIDRAMEDERRSVDEALAADGNLAPVVD